MTLSCNAHRSDQYPQQTFLLFLFNRICSLRLTFPANGTFHLCAFLLSDSECSHSSGLPALYNIPWQLFLSACSVICSKLESGGVCWSPWVWQQSASHLMDHETRNAVLVLLSHMAVWDISQVLYNEIWTTNYNINHQSSLYNSCLCLFFRFENVFAADDWMGMPFTESVTVT